MPCSVWALVDEELTEHMSQAQDLDARRWLFMMMNSVSHIQLTRMCHALGNFACPMKTDPRWYFPKPSSVTCYLIPTHLLYYRILVGDGEATFD
jgi:hypothetical protein